MSLPLTLNFVVKAASASNSISCDEGKTTHSTRLSLTLKATGDDDVIVQGGRELSKHDVYLDLVGGIQSPSELTDILGADEIGYMINTPHKPSMIHGAVAWMKQDLPYYLLQMERRMVRLTISNVLRGAWDDPTEWKHGKENIFRISSIHISGTNELPDDE